MITAHNVYIGEWKHRPEGIDRYKQFDHVHPRHFVEVPVSSDGWTNNPYIVDLFNPECVYVCSSKGVRCLTECPRWKVWKEEFSTGEFWSFVGENWIPEGDKE